MKRTLLAVWVLLLALLAGCQTTPEQPVVVQKDLEQMIEKAVAESSATPAPDVSGADYAALCAYYGVPERYQTTVAEDSLTVSCDVAIELPEAMKLPLARVKAGKFSQERVTALFRALTGGTPMYLWPQQWDKAYYERQILDIRAQLAAATDAGTIGALNDWIADMEKAYAAAPETIELTPSDGTLQTMDVENDKTHASIGTTTNLDAMSDPRDADSAMLFSVYNDIDYTDTGSYSYEDADGNLVVIAPRSCSRLSFLREGNYPQLGEHREGRAVADVTELSLTDNAADGCLLKTTPRQAREAVEALLAKAGVSDMAIASIELYTSRGEALPLEKLDALEKEAVAMAGQNGDVSEKQAYVARLLRLVNGVMVESVDDYSETGMDGVAYGREWWYETLTVAVDDEGVASLSWVGPLDVIEVLSENASIRPWADIQNIFEKMMAIQYAYLREEDMAGDIAVTRVALCLQRIMEKDSFDTGLLIPVWNFYGTTTMKNSGYVEDRGCCPLLSVNAIDGSVIDISKGY
jgi:hypothetical protein